MNFKKYKNRIKEYLSSKGYSDFNNNISCPFHDDKEPSMKVYDEMAKCFSGCDKKDIYDFVGLFENLNTKVEQFKFIEKLYGNSESNYKTEKFKINDESYNKIYEYIKKQINTKNGKDYIRRFTNFRKYNEKFSMYLGYWPGLEKVREVFEDDILKKAGIPLPKNDNKYSSWSPEGVVFKFENGFKLMYVRKNKETGKYKTIKRGSGGSHTFPYPKMPEKKIILVEAEISAIAMRINCFENAVATGGINGINNQDIDRLLTLEEIVICYDGDEKGVEAAEKLANKLYYKKLEKENCSTKIKICELPDNCDPDDLIKSDRLHILKTCIKNSKTYTKEQKNERRNNNQNSISDNFNIDDNNGQVSNDVEESFFIKNYKDAENMRTIPEFKKTILYRNDLAYQESARLYFCEKLSTGLKLKLNDNTIWLYDEKKKYWYPKLQKINHEPIELFIKKYRASWTMDVEKNEETGKSKKRTFRIQKTIKTKNEIEKNFIEYVEENVEGEDNPFQKNNIPKNISCKNCILVWNNELKKFEKKEHDKKYNMTVQPFNFNYLDFDNLTEDQKERCKIIEKYFYNLVSWIDNEKEKSDMINFLLSYIGYTFTAWREKCFFIWIGRTDSGKTALKNLLSLIHGSKYADVRFARWAKHTNAHDYELLPGKLLLADDDFAVGGRIPEQELKTLSSNETVTVNPKHISQYSITNTATALMLTNGTPRAEDLCVENRLYAIPFNADFSREKRNEENDKIINIVREHETLELLFNMAIRIAEKTIFKHGNFTAFIPEKVKTLSEHVINTASSIMMWLDDMQAKNKIIIDRDNKILRIKRTDLYNMYVMYTSGMKKGLHSFYESIRQKFTEVKSGGDLYFLGIGEKTQETVDYTQPQEKFKFEE